MYSSKEAMIKSAKSSPAKKKLSGNSNSEFKNTPHSSSKIITLKN